MPGPRLNEQQEAEMLRLWRLGRTLTPKALAARFGYSRNHFYEVVKRARERKAA